MSLQEEIAHLIEEVIVDPLQYQSITQSGRIINKVLDAAVEKMEQSCHELGMTCAEAYYIAKGINKLRSEK